MTHIPGVPVPFDAPGDWKPCSPCSDGRLSTCRSCNGTKLVFRVHESSCGGYEDDEIKCLDCNYSWWVDGPDA